jgi:hypothetical protein
MVEGLTAERPRKDGPAWSRDKDPAKDESAPAEQSLLEKPIIEPESHALEFPSEIVEDGACEGVGEDIPKDVLLAISESGIPRWEAGPAESIILAALFRID